jgi:hypothetical protein
MPMSACISSIAGHRNRGSMPPASASFISVGYRWMLLPDWVHIFWYRTDSGIGIFVHFWYLTDWIPDSLTFRHFKKGVHLARPYCWQWKETHPVRSDVHTLKAICRIFCNQPNTFFLSHIPSPFKMNRC